MLLLLRENYRVIQFMLDYSSLRPTDIHSEVILLKSRKNVYDSLARKVFMYEYTQLREVTEETAIRYLKELEAKYSPGAVIADVSSNRVGANARIFEENGGDILQGQMILEVPVQKKPVPKRVLDYANEHRIKIRDTNNKIYN